MLSGCCIVVLLFCGFCCFVRRLVVSLFICVGVLLCLCFVVFTFGLCLVLLVCIVLVLVCWCVAVWDYVSLFCCGVVLLVCFFMLAC